MSLDSLGLGDDYGKQMFIKTVHYKGNKVAMKDINYTSLTRSLLMELKILKDIQHDHIVRFIGACFNQGKSILLRKNILSYVTSCFVLTKPKLSYLCLSFALLCPKQIFPFYQKLN